MYSNRYCLLDLDFSTSFHRKQKGISSKRRSSNKEIVTPKNNAQKKNTDEDEWSDIRFDNEFWANSPAFQRPNKEVALKAAINFVFLYRNGNGTGEDWEKVITILLLYLRYSGEYVLHSRPGNDSLPKLTSAGSVFSKDMSFTGSRGKTITFKTVDGKVIRVDSEICTQWATNMLEKLVLSNVNVDSYLYYLGFLCLYMLRLMAESSVLVEQVIMRNCLSDMMRTCSSYQPETGFEFTPPPHADAYLKLKQALTRGNCFRNNILIWLQSSMSTERKKSSHLKDIISLRCVDILQTNSLGVFSWLLKASLQQRVTCYRVLYVMATEMRNEEPIIPIWNYLKRCNEQERRSWQVSRLLDSSVHREISVDNNRLCTAVLVVLATGSTKQSDEIWKSKPLQHLEFANKDFNSILESAHKIEQKLKLERVDHLKRGQRVKTSSFAVEEAIKVPYWMTWSMKRYQNYILQ